MWTMPIAQSSLTAEEYSKSIAQNKFSQWKDLVGNKKYAELFDQQL